MAITPRTTYQEDIMPLRSITPHHSSFRRFAAPVSLLALLALLLSACAPVADPVDPQATSSTTSAVPRATIPGEYAAYSLIASDSCDALLGDIQQRALDHVTPWGLEGMGYGYIYDDMLVGGAIGDVVVRESAGATAPEMAPDMNASTTNVQVMGVDEADIVKTDGSTIFTVSGTNLYAVDAASLKVLDTIPLDNWGATLLLDGDRLVVFSSVDGGRGGVPMPMVDTGVDTETSMIAPQPNYWRAQTDVSVFDVTDPSDMRLVSTILYDGGYLTSRLADGVVRVATTGSPTNLTFVAPTTGSLRAERAALAANMDIIENSTLDDWFPYYVATSAADGTATEGNILTCDSAYLPPAFAGFGFSAVTSFDPQSPLDFTSFGVMTSSQTVYATNDSLYMATQQYVDWDTVQYEQDDTDTYTTELHKFLLDGLDARYTASGTVPGFLLSQWSLDEYDSVLRVATTSAPAWWSGGESSSQVLTLSESDGTLTVLDGRGDLGVGEQIRSVRFMGPVAYVVTFRQTDPLYVLDLTDPTDLQLTGELKVPGYSAYLHPITEDLLMGVGRSGDADGRITGAQISLFDVSDPVHPVLADTLTIPGASSDVEWDHHAFLYWGGTAYVPFSTWGPVTWLESDAVTTPSEFGSASSASSEPTPELTAEPDPYQYNAGMLAVDVDANMLVLRGVITHDPGSSVGIDDYTAPITRALGIDTDIFTLSDIGILKSDQESLAPLGFVEVNAYR